ncbi:conserved hypothetical protein [uncultured Mycobacterium sp.]|uniref:Toprim domain-containing protein n=1 Tax=uncultured Mycobacterium sp. TaxID=171292 RepID=A0A1Y5PHP1_9MYCO|nr:conserved hypothetical protein [uncultured Mycobacterium sp.]
MSAASYERILGALRGQGRMVRESGDDKAMAQCPAHDDRNPSLSIGPRRDGKGVVVKCFAGCDTADVLAALRLTMVDLFDDTAMRDVWNPTRTYTYGDGRMVERRPNSNGGKDFWQQNAAGCTALFHADLVGDAPLVFVCEGEKDVEAVEAVGGVAVCSAMGAGNADKAEWSPLRGKAVVVVAHRDTAGKGYADKVMRLLDDVAASVSVVQAAVGNDAADHIAAGLSLGDLVPVPAGESPPQAGGLLGERGVTGDWLDGQQFAPLEFAVDGIIPEGLGLLVAPPKKGKSFLVADIGLAVAAGGTALGAIPVKQRPVLYLALEDGHRRLQDRFRRIRRGAPIPAGITVVNRATPGEAVVLIDGYLDQHAAEKPFVIVDTFGKIKPPRRPGQEAYLADYEAGAALKNLVDAVPGASLLLVHHTRKAEVTDFVDSVSGTNGVAGAADFILALNRKRLANDAVLNVTGRDVLEAQYALIADQGILWRLDGMDLLDAAATMERRSAEEKKSDRMLDVLRFVEKASDPVTATDVAKAVDGLTGDTAGTYLRRLAAEGLITKAGRGLYLKLSEVSVSRDAAGQGMQ